MAKSPLFLARFDARCEFVTAKAFPCGGRQQVVGQPFDRSLVSTRTLRLLYEQRKIVPAHMPNGQRQQWHPGRGYVTIADTMPRPAPQPPQDGLDGIPGYGGLTAEEYGRLNGWEPPAGGYLAVEEVPFEPGGGTGGVTAAAGPVPQIVEPGALAPGDRLVAPAKGGGRGKRPTGDELVEAKKIKGEWFVVQGKDRLAGPFKTRAEADDMIARAAKRQRALVDGERPT